MFEKMNASLLKKYLEVKAFLADKEASSEYNDGGTTNWAIMVAIGIGIASILFGLMKTFLPDIWAKVTAKILEFFA